MAKRKRGWPKGRKKSAAHKKAISAGLRRYWKSTTAKNRRKFAKHGYGRKSRSASKARGKTTAKRGRGRPKGSKNKVQYTKGSWSRM